MDFKELKEKLYWLDVKESEWHRHKNGLGWVQNTARVDDSCRVEGIVSGNAQVFGDARVFGNAQVFGDARVFGNAQVSGDAQVSGNARVSGDAWVFGNAQVFGDARVSGDAWVSGDAQVFGDAWVFGNAQVSGDAQVSGNARVSGDAWVFGNAQVFGDARVSGDAWVSGDAQVFGDAWETSPLQVQASRHHVTTCSHTELAIGCHRHAVEYWLENFKRIGKIERYSEAEIEEYGNIIKFCQSWLQSKFPTNKTKRDKNGRFCK